MGVNIKQIREECDQMSAGWELAPDVEFNGITKAQFDRDRAEALALEDEIKRDEAALKAKKDRRDDKYKKLSGNRVKAGKGIAGHKDYGEDSEIYGSSGFIRKSERKSGLHRGNKNNGGNT
jgi:hypothetical protein